MTHHDHDAAAAWDAGTPAVQAILAQGFAAYAVALPELPEAFHLTDRTIRCIDEGTPGGIHIAGAGILAPFDDVVAWKRAAQVDGVTSHVACGAANLYVAREGHDTDKAEHYAIEQAKALAAALGVPYTGHITELARPLDFHDARAVYVDGSGHFDPSRVPALPKGFVISRRYVSPSYALQEAEVSIGIALGSHGFGDRFTPELPLLVVAVGDPSDHTLSAEALTAELDPLVALQHGRVRLERIEAPAG